MTTYIEIPAVPPIATILTTTKPIRTTWDDGQQHEGWEPGKWPEFVTWTPECAIVSTDYPKCHRTLDCDGGAFVEAIKPTSSPPDSPVAISWWITAAETCSDWGYLTVDQHKARVERALMRDLGRRVSNYAQTGIVNGGEQCVTIFGDVVDNISMADAAQIVSTPLGAHPSDGYSPVSLCNAIGGLLRGMAECGGETQVTFHMPIEALASLDHGGRVTRRGDHFVLFDEYPVIFSSGYTGAPPNVPANGPVPAAALGTGWIYATGPVYHAVSEWTHFTGIDNGGDRYSGADFISTAQNIVEVRAEKLAVVAFDPCCVMAALATFCA